VLAAVTTSASLEPDVAALTGSSHLAVAAKEPAVRVEVPAAELTAITLTGPDAVLDDSRFYAVTDVGGPAVVLVPSTGSVSLTVSGAQVVVAGGPDGAAFVAVLMTAGGATVARGTLDADTSTNDTVITSPGGAITAALVAPTGARCIVAAAP